MHNIFLFSDYGDKIQSLTLRMGTLLNKEILDTAQKFSFPLGISYLNVTTSLVFGGTGHIY